MNVFAVNLASERVNHRYLEILVVGTIPVKVLCEDLAMRDRVGIGFKFQSDPIPHRDAVFHIKEKFLHGSQPWFVLLASQFLFLTPATTRQLAGADSARRPAESCGRSAEWSAVFP
jgi:hypothetical protein